MSVILLIRKRTWLSAWLLICLGCLSAIFWSGFRQVSVPVSGAEQESGPAFRTVVIDPGHGGQDGGAVAPDVRRRARSIWRFPSGWNICCALQASPRR